MNLTIDTIREAQRLLEQGSPVASGCIKLPLKVIESPHLTKKGHWKWAKCTWWERLFSTQIYSNPHNPKNGWKPLKKYKVVIPIVPQGVVYLMNNDTLVAHPAVAGRIRTELYKVIIP